MNFEFGGLLLAVLCSGVYGSQPVHNIQWLPCPFEDEFIRLNEEGHKETTYFTRDAVLQFGNPGDRPVHSGVITFLVTITSSEVDMRRFVEGDDDTVQCKIRRYITSEAYGKDTVMRWPGLGAQENDVWFTCVLRHTHDLFIIKTFLRHTHSQGDVQEWIKVGDEDLLTTSAAMVILTRTPSAYVGLMKDKKLHCQYAVDHKQPNVTVEWRLRTHSDRTKIFSFSGHTGKSEGSGVSLKAVAVGIASLKIPVVKQANEGTYTCSVLIPPLYSTHDIPLSIQEPPRVSLNVDTTLTVMLGQEKKVICNAEGYYPLEVNIEWLREPMGANILPEVLKNVLHSSHRNNHDGSYSFSAFFLLIPRLEDSGYVYTCRVTHQSLRVPIRKRFTLTVSTFLFEEDSMLWYISLFGFLIIMAILLVCFLPRLICGRRRLARKLF